jgi:hypothetical protein
MEGSMTNIEKRLASLEKRATAYDELWHAVNGQNKALGLIFTAIGVPICAANPSLLPKIIANLLTYEETARMANEHAATILQFRGTRESFERITKAGKSGSRSANDDGPHRGK